MKTDTQRLLPRWLSTVVILVLLVFALTPVLYMLFASVNDDLAVARGDFWPRAFHPGNYAEIWDTVALGDGLANSVLVAGSVAVVSALVSVATAYVLVRFTFFGRGLILRGLLALQSIPGTLMLLPVFVLFANLARILSIDVIGTRWALFVTYLTFALP